MQEYVSDFRNLVGPCVQEPDLSKSPLTLYVQESEILVHDPVDSLMAKSPGLGAELNFHHDSEVNFSTSM
jgi:hypothetical protein